MAQHKPGLYGNKTQIVLTLLSSFLGQGQFGLEYLIFLRAPRPKYFYKKGIEAKIFYKKGIEYEAKKIDSIFVRCHVYFMKLVRDQFPMTFSTSFFTECIEVYGTYKQGGGPQALDLAARSKGQFFFLSCPLPREFTRARGNFPKTDRPLI